MSEVPENQKKQYLLMVDDVAMALMAQIYPRLAYVPIEGMPLDNKHGYQVLVSPLSPAAQEVLDKIAEEKEPEAPKE